MLEIVYKILFIFAMYSVLGWCTEVVFYAVTYGKYVNRGFLSGPVCPIYGIGVSIVLYVLTPIKGNLLLLFLGSFLLTTVLEFITGYILEKVFNEKWWDYSNEPFHVKGYICLKFSLIWGLACVFVVNIVQVPINHLFLIVPEFLGIPLLIVFYSIFIFDLVITVMTLLNMKKRISIINTIEEKLRQESDRFGENLYDGVNVLIKAKDKGLKEINEIKEKHMEEVLELKVRYDRVLGVRNKGIERITKAFPKLELLKEKEMAEKLKNYFKKQI